MHPHEKHSRMIQSFEKALKKALPDGVELLHRGEISSGNENENEQDDFSAPRYLIEVRRRFQVYRDWYEKKLRNVGSGN